MYVSRRCQKAGQLTCAVANVAPYGRFLSGKTPFLLNIFFCMLNVGYAVFQPMTADKFDGFDEGANGIALHDPIDGIMNVRFDAGCIRKDLIKA